MKFPFYALFAVLILCAGPAVAQVGDAPEEGKAAYRRGVTLQRLGDVPQAIDQFKLACEKGDARGCLASADNLRTGNTVPQDFDAAKSYYDIACARDLGAGCAGSAYMAFQGLGQTASAARALSLYEQACNLGEPSGCAGAGNILVTGSMGVTRDRARGAQLLREACDDDYDWACNRLKDLGQNNRPR